MIGEAEGIRGANREEKFACNQDSLGKISMIGEAEGIRGAYREEKYACDENKQSKCGRGVGYTKERWMALTTPAGGTRNLRR
jgi:hypothetical protein